MKHIRIISDPTTIKVSLIPELKKWLPEGRYTTEKMGKSYEYMFYTDTGFKIELMTYDQDLKEFESVTVDIILMDEPPPYAIYLACMARTRRGGQIGIFFTPLMNAGWAYDEFTKSPNDLKADSKFLVNATMEDNCKIHGVRGILEHHQIELIFKNMPEDEKEARAKGKFQALQGLILKQLNSLVHFIKPFDTNPEDYCFVELLDPHPQMPDALMYVAIDKLNRAFVYEEVYRSMKNLDDLHATIRGSRQGKRIIGSYMDPLGFGQDQHQQQIMTEYSLANWLDSKGIHFEKASKARHEGIRRIQTALTYEEKLGVMVHPPTLYICENCIETKKESLHWQWEDWRGSKKYEKNPKGTPVDKDDHMMENLGRFFLSNLKFVPMPENYYDNLYPNSPLSVYTSPVVGEDSLQIY